MRSRLRHVSFRLDYERSLYFIHIAHQAHRRDSRRWYRQRSNPRSRKSAEGCGRGGGREVALTEFDWGAERYLRDGTTLPADAVEMLHRDFDAILLGAMGDPRVPTNIHAADILLGLRSKLDLYVNARPCVLFDKRFTPLKDRTEKDVNFIVFRENTEGLYVQHGRKFQEGNRGRNCHPGRFEHAQRCGAHHSLRV